MDTRYTISVIHMSRHVSTKTPVITATVKEGPMLRPCFLGSTEGLTLTCDEHITIASFVFSTELVFIDAPPRHTRARSAHVSSSPERGLKETQRSRNHSHGNVHLHCLNGQLQTVNYYFSGCFLPFICDGINNRFFSQFEHFNPTGVQREITSDRNTL